MAQVIIYAQSAQAIACDVLEVNEAHVQVRFKKPRSSKKLIQTFPQSQVLSVVAGEDGELNGEILVTGRLPVYEISGEVSVVNGQTVVTDEDGVEYFINPNADAEIIAEDAEEVVTAKGKKAPAKPKAKAKAAVEEDEEEDEEEEEEAPAPKSKAKGKAKAKPVEEEEEDEDEEDEEDEEEEEAPAPKSKAKSKAKASSKKKADDDEGEDW